jgi:hypothetical protein
MANTSFIEGLESRRLLSGTIRPDVDAPASFDHVTVYETVTAFHDANSFVGAIYQIDHSATHFNTYGLNNSFTAYGTYKYSRRGHIAILTEDTKGVTSTVTLSYSSRHAGTFYNNFGNGIFVEGTFRS